MLRWIISILVVANLIALAAQQGLFGPQPAAGPREPSHLTQQVHPQALRVAATVQAAEAPAVGGPIASPSVESMLLGASSAEAASATATGASDAASAPAASAATSAAPATSAASAPHA
ncbi:hypothetical protein AB4851_17910 [Burkholderia sp. 22PA0099]|uniref:hypothetical protein n=1 Tax=Burkholderia sp. 22PA0099 TaxID=3237372 RepID=UPI0039C0C883